MSIFVFSEDDFSWVRDDLSSRSNDKIIGAEVDEKKFLVTTRHLFY
jgi:hypothetical protein